MNHDRAFAPVSQLPYLGDHPRPQGSITARPPYSDNPRHGLVYSQGDLPWTDASASCQGGR